MSNIIPPLLSNSPPPPPSPEEEEEDEFGDFTVANDISYGCDGFSPLPSPDLSSGDRSPFKILNAVDHVLQKTKEEENSVLDLDGLENKTSKCDCSEEINSLGFDKLGKNSEIRSDKLRESVEIIPVSDISDSVSKHSCSSDFKAKENDCFKTNNNEDPFETFDLSHKENSEVSYISDKAEVDTCSPIHFEDCSPPQNGLEPTSASVDEIFETIKSNWGFDGTSRKSDADISADLEIVDIFSKSESLDANCDPSQSACVSDSSFIERDSSKLSEPSSYEFLSDIQEKSEIIIDKTHEESLKSINIDEAKAENGEFTNFSSKIEENLAVKSDLTKKNCEISKSSEESKKPAEFSVKVDSWHSPLQDDPQAVPEADVESDDEFADFASHQANPEPHAEIAIPPSDEQDDFEDFGEFTSTICAATPATHFPNEEDDFQSFADFSKIPESACLQLDEKEAFSKAEQIIKEMFPASEDVVEDFGYFELAENDFIFKQLRDVTDTPALTYQWSKSAGQKALLKSLNIDARNILYGPSWNSSMPRFAANLGLQPLEPIKTEHPTSSILKPSPSTSQTQNVDIPSAQFDWTGSGLVNPLDSLPKDTVSSLPDPRGPSELPAKKSPGTIFELSNPTPENSSASKLDDFEDFTSYQSPEILQVPEWTNALPLRESYISNTTPEAPSGHGIEAWLQPTILTPELPRKTMVEAVDEDTSPKVVANDENNDEFTEFHGVHDTTVVVGDCGSQKVACDFLSDFESIKNEGLVSEVASDSTQVELTGFDRIQVEGVVEIKSVLENGPVDAEEDEFTDFQSSKPQITDPVLFCAPIMEPLKPVQVHASNAPTQINWPDPGITNEDIRKFEEVFSRPAPPKQEEPAKPPSASPEKQQTSSDNEEWTDFVSVKKPSPVHKLRTNDRDRTSSPDLPLSVFNLGMVQPMKQPIPVITPHGLVQTRLSAGSAMSSASSVTSSPKTQARNNANSRLTLQPLTISEQYVSHAYNFSAPPNYGNSGQTKSNATSSNWSFASQAAQDEDEWGEFVSSPLPPQQNGHPPSAAGWGGSSTNIITNPRHFGGGRVSNSSKGAVSNLVLPELDFVAPKGRTVTSRKK